MCNSLKPQNCWNNIKEITLPITYHTFRLKKSSSILFTIFKNSLGKKLNHPIIKVLARTRKTEVLCIFAESHRRIITLPHACVPF